jgi:hypothetical protein
MTFQADRHPTKRSPTPVEEFYGAPSPSNAIALAISDHRAYAGGIGQSEFVRQLQLARDLVDNVEFLKSTLQAALCVNNMNLPKGAQDWPAGTDTPNGPDFIEIERRIKSALTILHWR